MDVSERLNSFLFCCWQAVHATLLLSLLLCAHLPWWCSLHWRSNHLCLFQWTVVLLLGSFQILTQWVNVFLFICVFLNLFLSLYLWLGHRCSLFAKCVILDIILVTQISCIMKAIASQMGVNPNNIQRIYLTNISTGDFSFVALCNFGRIFGDLRTHIISGMLFTCSRIQLRGFRSHWIFPTTKKERKTSVCFFSLGTFLFGKYFR